MQLTRLQPYCCWRVHVLAPDTILISLWQADKYTDNMHNRNSGYNQSLGVFYSHRGARMSPDDPFTHHAMVLKISCCLGGPNNPIK